MIKVIFVAGVHGVGKGTLCKALETRLGFPHFSASSLIKSVKNSEVDNNKIVVGANENQDHLVVALERLNVKSDYILLDGHFCLQTDSGVFEIPISTYQGINLVATLLLTDDVIEIHKRLSNRDGSALDVNILKELQSNEIERAKFISDNLNYPLLETSVTDIDGIQDWIANIVSR